MDKSENDITVKVHFSMDHLDDKVSAQVAQLQEIYHRIETNDDGEIDIKTVVEHIKAIEAGSGKNSWVASLNKL